MKKLLITMFITLNAVYPTLGQNCVKGIRTNPEDPKNPEIETIHPTLINPWLSNFNIGINNGISFSPIYLNKDAIWDIAGWNQSSDFEMVNPFSFNMPSQYSYLQSPINPIGLRDFNWEDGWELFWLNTGYYPNGNPINIGNPNQIIPFSASPSHPSIPYIILYNKYRGTMRVFTKLTKTINGSNFQNAQLNLQFASGSPVSGLFRHLDGFDLPLDQQTQINSYRTTNFNDNNSQIWWSSDLQLGFDPCICNMNPSLEMWYKTFDTWNVNLTGHTIGLDLPLQDASGNPIYKNFLAQSTVEASRKGSGSLIYHSLGNLLDDYNNKLDDYTIKLKDYNSIENQLKRETLKLAKEITINGGSSILAPVGTLKNFIIKHAIELDTIKKFPTNPQAEDWAKAINKASKNILGKGFDYLSTQIIDQDFLTPPIRPTMPTATFEQMTINGTIDQSNDYFVTKFSLPGVPVSNIGDLTAHNYPAYNEVSGLFALIATPEVSIHFKEQAERSRNDMVRIISNTYMEAWWKECQSHETYLKLNAPLRYKLNRTLDIDDSKTKLRVCFVVEYKTNMINNPLTQNNNATQFQYIPNYNTLIGNFTNSHILPNKPSTAGGAVFGEKITANSEWYDIEDAQEVLFGISSNNCYTHAQRFMFPDSKNPGSSLTNLIFNQWNNEYLSNTNSDNNAKYEIVGVKMKILADIYYNKTGTDGRQISTTQVFTYNLFDKTDGNKIDFIASKGAWLSSPDPIKKYNPGKVELGTQVISPSSQYVSKVNGNDIYIIADEISLSGNISVTPGKKLILQSFTETSDNPESEIQAEVQKEIIPRSIYGLPKTVELTDDELKKFCQNNGTYPVSYRASELNKQENQPQVANSIGVNKQYNENLQYGFKVFPNPSLFNEIYFEFNLPLQLQFEITINDISGQEIHAFHHDDLGKKGLNRIRLNTENLSSGIYFCRLTLSNGVIQTKKVVIAK